MIEKISRLIEINNTYSLPEIEANYIYSDSIFYEFEKLYEDSQKLSIEFHMRNEDLHIDDLRGIRNRIAHDYAGVSLKKLIATIVNDLPILLKNIQQKLDN